VVISLLWRGQEQGGWVTHPMIESVGENARNAVLRVLEVATFYTMFNLEPVGTYLVQVCTTTPCWLKGSDAVVDACKKQYHPMNARFPPTASSLDGSGMPGRLREIAPILQIGSDFYKILTGPITEKTDRRFARRKTGQKPARPIRAILPSRKAASPA